MKCSVHADQTVIMVCRAKQCESCFVCVLCIAGSHNGHKMATVEEAGKAAEKRLHDASMANVNFLEDQKREMETINSMEQTTSRNAIVTSSEERLGHILETEDFLQIIQHEKKSMTTPKVESLPKDTTPDIGAGEINKTLATGSLSALQQCESRSRFTDDDTSDFVGTVYRQKSLQSVSSFSLGNGGSIKCVALSKKDQSYIAVFRENQIYVCDEQGVLICRLVYESEPRGMVITDDKCLLVGFCDKLSVEKMTLDGKQLDTFSTAPLMPNKICVASNGDILVTLLSSFKDPLPDIVGAVSRYTPQGKRMVTFERDRFGNIIHPKYIAASRVSNMVAITTHTNKSSEGAFHGHLMVMTGDLQVKFRYLSDGRVIPGDEKYLPDISTKHFCVGFDSNDNIVLGDLVSGSIEIIDSYGQILQYLGKVDGLRNLVFSSQDELWIGKTSGRVEVFKYT
ncbi:uncharacterized protein LOC110442723 [Mizuhopecten yessoensis]|uniref:uncharacterized protein LOC110442723 n=1 Tax=Mizuhopecten yessoensis TaxID=6573 RepID=UPI000B4571EF|nr:uncharacterized protein LOC110442723 [Mizuhopecten yessoensis]